MTLVEDAEWNNLVEVLAVPGEGSRAERIGRLLGNRGMRSVYLTGKRGLSKANIRKLAEHFNVRADYFL